MQEKYQINNINDTIIRLMKEKHISQRELSHRTGLAESSISRYITKKRVPSLYSLIKISYALNVDINEFV